MIVGNHFQSLVGVRLRIGDVPLGVVVRFTFVIFAGKDVLYPVVTVELGSGNEVFFVFPFVWAMPQVCISISDVFLTGRDNIVISRSLSYTGSAFFSCSFW